MILCHLTAQAEKKVQNWAAMRRLAAGLGYSIKAINARYDIHLAYLRMENMKGKQ